MQRIPLTDVRQWAKVGDGDAPQSISTVCHNCGERGIFTLASQHDDGHRRTVAATGRCPGCNAPSHFWSLRNRASAEAAKGRPEAVFMYPTSDKHYPQPELSALPEALRTSFVSTIDAYNARNYPATAVGARRTLEGIFKFRVSDNDRKKTLEKMIDLVSSDPRLAAPLTDLSHAVRDGGNLGAHFDPDNEPTDQIARKMLELLEYLASYLYVLPDRIKGLEQELNRDKSAPPSAG